MKRAARLLAVFLAAVSAHAQPFVTAREVDLTKFLAPPPVDSSEQTKNELAEIIAIQLGRTATQEARAKADAEETVWRFAGVLGPKFAKESLPLTAALFERLHETEGAVVDAAKESFKRPRPYQLSKAVHPVVKLSASGSYPSGHATGGALMGIVLANMVPEKRRELMDRAWQYGENRIVAGVHYRSDVDAGRIAGALIAEALFARDDFRAQFDAARKELRSALSRRPAPASPDSPARASPPPPVPPGSSPAPAPRT